MLKDHIKVALIDDDNDDYILIKDLLEAVPNNNYQISWFEDSSKGLAALKSNVHDVYLVDYHLDSKTGLDLLDEIQKSEIKKSIILLTGKGNYETDVAAMNKGASDFLSKDQISSEVLERSIRYCIKRAQDYEKIKDTEKLKIEKEAAFAASKTKSMFLANMSHEIRTPLGAIIGFTDLALENNIDEKDRTEFLATIKRNSEHLLELINDILDLSKVEAGQLQLTTEYFNWRSVINEVIETLKPKLTEKNLSTVFDCSPFIPALLKSDSHRLRQVLINLVGNAVKFTEHGKVTIECHIHPPNFVIDISDTGLGIAKEDQQKLFQPFQQANPTLSHRHGGTGLGLDLSKKIAFALGGDLTLLSSHLGSGSKFRLILPALFTLDKLNEPYSMIAKVRNPEMGKKIKVLLVEDSADNQFIVRHFLKNTSFEVESASNGAEGLKKVQENIYDIVLMDIQMPILDGFQATHILRQRGFTKPIVALTAHALKEDREHALSVGFTEYITKPIKKECLIETLERVSIQCHPL